jgi:hypothetical protein
MNRVLIGILAAGILAMLPKGAQAQGTAPANPGGYAPNMYNRGTQPLSPYLNLLRGGNPGVNYYYGVRPGTTGGGGFGGGGIAPGGFGRTSFPIQYTQDDALLLPEPGEGYILPPAGHPTVFNNTLGYYPGPFGMGSQRGRMGFGGAGGIGGGGGAGAQQRTGVRR